MFGFLRLHRFKKKWRKLNPQNTTFAVDEFNMDLVQVGIYTYGGLKVLTYNNHNKLIVGNFCSIGPEVAFIVSADHVLNHVSTFPFKVKVCGENYEGYSKGDIVVDDDVWIGYGAIILSGVHIGQGAVIAAGAVVNKDVPPYAIAGGVPARVIKYRFKPDTIKELLSLDFSKLNKEEIINHVDDLYSNELHYSWMPKKK